LKFRLLCLASVLFAGCEWQEPLKKTARVVEPVSTAYRVAGEPCHREAASVCLPGPRGLMGLCFHYGPGLDRQGNDTNYVCTNACDSDADCIAEFRCRSLAPGQGNSVCAPPPGFQPRRGTPRPSAH
jgi:hypothetical protein